MTPEEISVRQWQEMFRAGAFHKDDLTAQELAGWSDFYDPLNNKSVQSLAKVVMGITDPFILDNYYVWFKESSPAIGPLYGDVRFHPLSGESGGKYFLVILDSPHERMKWSLITERFGYGTPEFECKDIRNMVKYINQIGPELEQGFHPPFVAEKRAVEVYAGIYGEPLGIHVYREGEHRYSYTSFLDEKQRNVIAIADLEGAPADFAAEHAEKIMGIHVYCAENAGKPPPDITERYKSRLRAYKKERGEER